MPRYHFAVRGTDWLPDLEGTELPNDEAALEHARKMIRELTRNDDGYAGWRMQITQFERIVHEVAFDLIGGDTK